MSRAALPPRRPVGCAQRFERGGELAASTVLLGRGEVGAVDTFTHRVGVRYAPTAAEWIVVVDVHHAGGSPYATRVMGRNSGWDLATAAQVAAFEVADLTDGEPAFCGPWIGGAR